MFRTRKNLKRSKKRRNAFGQCKKVDVSIFSNFLSKPESRAKKRAKVMPAYPRLVFSYL